MRVCFLMEAPRSEHSVTHEVIDGLKAAGAEVEVITEGSGLLDLARFRFGHDIYLFKSHSPLAESLAAAAHYRGCSLLNEYRATMKVRDKLLTYEMLQWAGLPTPRTFVARSLEALRPVAREMPVVVKPYRGRRGEGIEVCRSEAEFDALCRRGAAAAEGAAPDGDGLIFAQEYLEHEPFDYKAYAVGEQVHVIKRPFPAHSKEEKEGTHAGDDPELSGLVRRCGDLFGLQLYGVDLVRTRAGFSVIEVNCFPGYKGVPRGGERISQFILEHAGAPAGRR